ncbi:MAG: HD domain-containing protein [Bacteroidetes bacterium]|nr:HD domain-containing protein [Bacteroidota bacterium]
MKKNYQKIEEYVIAKLKSELPKDLYYHGYHHTLDVLRSAEQIGQEENLSEEEMFLLKVAVLFHDIGFTKVYKSHEEKGCEIAETELTRFGFNSADLQTICGMIMATKIPQNPKTKLERIIADSDLDYLGTDKFKKIGKTLYDEMKIYLNLESERQWNIIQMNFLRTHKYFTDFCKKNREAEKEKHLEEIISIVNSYD